MVDRRIVDPTPCAGCFHSPGDKPQRLDTLQMIKSLKQRHRVFKQLLEEADGWEALIERQWMLDDVLIDLEMIEAAQEDRRRRNV
jgi:hypothetical protein